MKKSKTILKISLIFTALLLLSAGAVFSQTTIKGKIIDAEDNSPLVGATVVLDGTTTGSQVALNGTFSFIATASGEQKVVVTYIGYLSKSFDVNLTGAEVDLGVIELNSSAIGIKEINIIANIAVDRKTPVAVSSISTQDIIREGGSLEVPELLNQTPSVYATKQGGGFGDSEIHLRGFDQRNIAIMVNGVPVNDMENGWVYWSNWAGIGDALRTMQVQRGLGASKLAINSVGGTINMVTKSTDAKKGGSIQASVTDYGNFKTILSLNTGKTASNWAISFVGSRTTGPGYIDETWVDAWSYYLSIAKEWDKHLLQLTAIGAPQKHGQRLFSVSEGVHDEFGNKYNQHWGSYEGNVLMERENFYHKPQIALNWYFTINEKAFLSTSAYMSFGRGGGTGTIDNRERNGDPTTGLPRFRIGDDLNGQIAWNAVADENATHTDTVVLATGEFLANGNLYAEDGEIEGEGGYQVSKNVLRNSVNRHNWYGIISTFNYNISEHSNIMVGIDARSYKGTHYREVRNLLGGDYFFQSLGNAVDGVAGRSQLFQVGDRIAYDNDGLVSYGGLFAQYEWSNENISAFITGTLSNTGYGKIDRYNFTNENQQKADRQSAMGYNFKIGFNWNINEHHNLYFNSGYYSRAPYWDFVFVNRNQGSLTPVNNILNEKITAFEVGYGLRYRWINLNLGYYYTIWADKSYTDGFRDANGDIFTAPVLGLDANHSGLELDFEIKATKWFGINGGFGLGDWEWTNDVTAEIFDDFGNPIDTVQIDAKGVKIADQPQTQVFGGLKFKPMKGLFVKFVFTYYNNLYRGYDVTQLDASYEQEKLPSYGLVDIHAGYDFIFAGLDAYAGASAFNVGNVVTPIKGDRFGNLWSFGTTFNFTIMVNF
jgi:hypothetical protein